MSDRRHPHRPFDPGLICGFLRGRGLAAAELLSDGKSNSNYRLTLDDGQTVVLRLRSRGEAAIAAREAFVMSLVRHLVPVPEELDRGDGWSIYTYLEGESLAQHPECAGPAAEALARIASVRFESAGWISADGSVSPFTFGGDEGGDFVAAMLARPDVRRWIGQDGAEAIARIMKRESGRLEKLGEESRLVHGDFNPTNILVRYGAVSGILDWEFSHAGTPYMDIGNLLRHADPERYADIRAGLEAGGMEVRSDWVECARLIDLSSQLEFLTSGRSDAFKRQCVGRIRRFIGGFGSAA